MEREFRDEGIERMPQEELEVTLSHGIGPDEAACLAHFADIESGA